MSRSFLWEAERVARDWAPGYLAARRITSVSPDGLVNVALHGGHADRQVRRLASQLLDEARLQAIRNWAAWYRNVRGVRVTLDELLVLASAEPGTTSGVTKTKLRKAVKRLVAEAAISASA